jgi:two-component system sensor histidine kinase UhpB
VAGRIDETPGASEPALDGEFARLEERCLQLEQDIRRSELERRHAMERLLRAEEQERRRLAAELHDDTVQVLTACLVALDRLEQTVETAGRDRIASVVTATRGTLAAATDRTRRLMFELRPTSLQQEGLSGALRDLTEQAGEEAGLTTSVTVPDARYPYVVEEIAYRTVREAIVNVRKHARATALEVVLQLQDGRLQGQVIDDGRGFEVAAALERSRRQRRMGLDTMLERLLLAGGSVDVSSVPGSGTVVSFELPLDVA